VFHDHQLIGEHEPEHWSTPAHMLAHLFPLGPKDHPDDLLVLRGLPPLPGRVPAPGELVIVQRYAHGSWHGAAPGLICSFVDEDPNCPNCHPAPP
jgi:hypothetical protein